MVTQVIKYQAQDGSLHESEEAAVYHERNTLINRYADTVINLFDDVINSPASSSASIKESIIGLFKTKSVRNVLKEFLELCADSSNT